MSRQTRTHTALGCILLLLLVAGVFLPALGNDFVRWDDDTNIYRNPHIQGLDSSRLAWMFTDFQQAMRYKPLTWLAWAGIYVLSGLRPFSYHVASLLLHALNTVLVFLFLRRVFLPTLPRDAARTQVKLVLTSAGLGALVWALHPLRVEAVAWATALPYCLATSFLLISALCLLAAHRVERPSGLRRGYYWLSVAAYGLALLAYPNVLGGVVLLLALEAYLYALAAPAEPWWQALRLRLFYARMLPFALLTAAFMGIALYARFHETGVWAAPQTVAEFSLASRIMQGFYVWAYYFWKPWVPFDLSPVYPTLVWFNPGDRAFVLSAVLVSGLTALLIWKRRKWPLALALWTCHLAVLVPTLGLTEHPHYPSDRYSYVQGLLWSVLLVAGMLKLRDKPRASVSLMAGAAVLAAGLGVMSYRQTFIWRNSPTLFRYMIDKLGDNRYRADIYYRLSHYDADQGALDAAIEHLREAIRIDPDFAAENGTLGTLLLKKGDIDGAIKAFQILVRINPSAHAHTSLGWAYYQKGQTAEAQQHYDAALKLDPNDADAHNKQGILLASSGNLDAAIAEFETALKLSPDEASATENLRLARALKAGKTTP